MSCIKVKLIIELIQIMPFIRYMILIFFLLMIYFVFSILLVLADFYTFILVAFVYVYEKRSLIDYLPIPDEYDLA